MELSDKIGVVGVASAQQGGRNSQARDEAMTALLMLGFAKPAVERLLTSTDWVNADGSSMTVEEIIKVGLQKL